MIRLTCAALALSVFASQAVAQATAPPLAEAGLQARIDALAASDGNGFELGMLQTLRGVERALQTGYRYDLDTGFVEIPVMRLMKDMGNPAPETPGPGALSDGVTAFLSDMAQARAWLDGVPEGSDPAFTLTLQDIWFDIDSDGTRDPREGAAGILAQNVLGWRAQLMIREQNLLDKPLTIRFDAADLAWLAAYTHLLSGIGEAILTFDPEPVIADLGASLAALRDAPVLPSPYDEDTVRAAVETLTARRDEIRQTLSDLRSARTKLSAELRTLKARDTSGLTEAESMALQGQRDTLTAQIDARGAEIGALAREAGRLNQMIEGEEAKLTPETGEGWSLREQYAREIDAVYILLACLRQQPDADRARAVRDHWKAMIAQNRRFWTLVAQETDDDREWLPNPRQTGALPISLPEGIDRTWLAVLDDAEAVLDGRLLVPHPMLPKGYGVNAAKWFDDPVPLDLLTWVHGIGAYPFAARGPRMSDQSWTRFERLTSGNAGSFAVFLN